MLDMSSTPETLVETLGDWGGVIRDCTRRLAASWETELLLTKMETLERIHESCGS